MLISIVSNHIKIVFFVKLQAKSLDLELTLFYPCHKKKKNNNKNPPPKSISGGCARRLKFDAQTTHGLLAEFRGLGVHVTRRTRTTTKFLDPKFFQTKIFFSGQKSFFVSKFFSDPNLFSDPNISPTKVFKPNSILDLNFFPD